MIVLTLADHPIIVTGHSLGASLSSMAALDLAEQFGASVTQWTFGSTRIGDEPFTTYFNSKVKTAWRTVNQVRFFKIHNFYREILSHIIPLCKFSRSILMKNLG